MLLALSGCDRDGSSEPTVPPPPVAVDLQNAVEALFLGSGPLNPGGGCLQTGFWRAYPRGSMVRVRVSTSISGSQRTALQAFLAQVPQLTMGGLGTAFELTAEADPRAAMLEVTLTNLSDGRIDQTCRPGAGGCTFLSFQAPGILGSARTVMRDRFAGAIHVHELGHGLLGLCHVDGNRVPDALMGNPQNSGVAQLNELERMAVRAVYGSALQPGAGREAFVRAGLVHASAATAPLTAPPAAGAPEAPEPRAPRREREGRERERAPRQQQR